MTLELRFGMSTTGSRPEANRLTLDRNCLRMPSQEERPDLNRRRTRLLLGLACGCIVIVIVSCWFVFSHGPVPVVPNSSVVAGVENANPSSIGGLDSAPAAIRQPVDHTESPAHAPLTPIPGDPSHLAVLAGRVEFADGTASPVLTLQARRLPMDEKQGFADLTARSDESERSGTGRTWASTRTDSDGGFVFSGLRAGYYYLSLGTHSGLGGVDGTYAAPSSRNRVILQGYVLRVRAIGRDGAEFSNAVITAQYQRDSDEFEQGYPLVQLTSDTDEQGRHLFCLPAPGECTVTSHSGDLSAVSDAIALRGAQCCIDSTLVMEGAPGNGALRISVRTCDPAGTAVSAYCIALLDPKTHDRLLRICSENAGPDGAIRNLPPGRYLAIVADRFIDPPALYFCDATSSPAAVELRDGGEINLELCVKLGGRISLSVTSDGRQQAGATPIEVRAELEGSDGGAPTRVYFRDPYEGGMRILEGVVPGKKRVSTELLAEGTYNLLLRVPGMEPILKVVTIHSGEASEVTVHIPGG